MTNIRDTGLRPFWPLIQGTLATDTSLLMPDTGQWVRTHALLSPAAMSNLLPDLSSYVLDLTPILAPVSGRI